MFDPMRVHVIISFRDCSASRFCPMYWAVPHCSAGAQHQANLTVGQSRAKSQVDRLGRDEKFEVGDEVFLSICRISVNQHLPSKLRRHWIGPYRVTKVISPVAYGLDLPQLGKSILSSMYQT